MALIVNTVNYEGKDVNMIIQECFNTSTFQTKFGARLIEAVKSKYFYWNILNDLELQPLQSCPTTGFNDVTLNQNVKSLCEFMALGKIAHSSLVNSAREINLKQGVLNEKVTQDVQVMNAIMTNLLSTITNQWDDIILNGEVGGGTGTYLDLCDGFITQWNSDPDIISIVGSLANFTVSGIITELNSIINNIPDCLMYSSNPSKKVKIAVSTTIARLYEQYLQQTAGFTGLASNPSNPGTLSFMGFDVIPLHNLPSNTAFATYSDNLMLVVDDDADFATLKVIDKSLYSSCDEIEIVMKARGGVGYGYASEIVLYQAA